MLTRLLKHLFRREAPPGPPAPAPDLPPPSTADVPLAEPGRMMPLLDRLAELGISHLTILPGDAPDPGTLVEAVARARQLGLAAAIRVRASELADERLIRDLATAGLQRLEILYLSAVSEIHDALAGIGDHRSAIEVLDLAEQHAIRPAAYAAIVPATWGDIGRTLEALASRRVAEVRLFAITSTDDQPSSWALPAGVLGAVVGEAEAAVNARGLSLNWCLPSRFDPRRSLAEQVRRGPRCGTHSTVRVEADGTVYAAWGPFRPAGNLFESDWKTIAQGEIFGGRFHCQTADPCDPAGWSQGDG